MTRGTYTSLVFKKCGQDIKYLPKGLTSSSLQRAVYWDIIFAGARLLITAGIRITSPEIDFIAFSPNGKSLITWPDVMKSIKWSSWLLSNFWRCCSTIGSGLPAPISMVCFLAFLYRNSVMSGMSWKVNKNSNTLWSHCDTILCTSHPFAMTHSYIFN